VAEPRSIRLTPAAYNRLRWWLLVVGDLLIAVAAYRLAFLLRTYLYIPIFQGLLPMGRYEELPHLLWLVVGSQCVWLHLGGVYDNTDARQGVFPRLLRATVMHVLFLVAMYYFTRSFGFPRSVFLTYFVLDLLLLTAWHTLVRRIVRSRGTLRVLVVGLTRQAEQYLARAQAGAMGHVELVGVVSSAPGPPSTDRFAGVPVLGGRDDVARLVREHAIDEVLITPGPAWQDRLLDTLSEEGVRGTRVLLAPSAYEAIIGRLEYLNLEDLLTLEVSRSAGSPSMRVMKRTADGVGAALLLLLFAPLAMVAALVTKLQDGGPVLFSQERLGEELRPFRIWKFRSMRPDAESATGPVLATVDDPRVTPWGRFMRKTRLDEVPQLWNVLHGEMSFVGPRPERPEFVARFLVDLPGYRERFRVKPGMTGLAQIHGHYLSTAENKLRYDLAYVFHQTAWLDLVILLQTLRVVLTRKGT
jgi:exopolysaccharide biosynthesis polyprenyl glycosylphosphotransferase